MVRTAYASLLFILAALAIPGPGCTAVSATGYQNAAAENALEREKQQELDGIIERELALDAGDALRVRSELPRFELSSTHPSLKAGEEK